jgi:hypothetical protein
MDVHGHRCRHLLFTLASSGQSIGTLKSLQDQIQPLRLHTEQNGQDNPETELTRCLPHPAHPHADEQRCMYVCRRLNLLRIRKDIDNSRSNLEPRSALGQYVARKKFFQTRAVVLVIQKNPYSLPPVVRNELRPRSNEPWSLVTLSSHPVLPISHTVLLARAAVHATVDTKHRHGKQSAPVEILTSSRPVPASQFPAKAVASSSPDEGRSGDGSLSVEPTRWSCPESSPSAGLRHTLQQMAEVSMRLIPSRLMPKAHATC